MKMYGWLIPAIGALAVIALIAVLVGDRNRWKGRAERYNAEAVSLVEGVKLAADNPKMERADARKQLDLHILDDRKLRDELKSLSGMVDELGKSARVLQESSDRALQDARERRAAAERGRISLEESAKRPRLTVCKPSAEVERRWRA
jgi:hypothetical protein